MSVVDIFHKFLGRPLDATEEDLLSHLSAQGIAKINRDVSLGISLAHTLSDLRTAFEFALFRRNSVQTHLSESAKIVIEKMSRPPTTDEMEMLSGLSPEHLASLLCGRVEEGEVLEDVVEDLAAEYKLEQLRASAQAFADIYRVPVSISHLVTTARPPAEGKTCPNVTKLGSRKVSVGINPARLWFEDGVSFSASPILMPSINTVSSIEPFEEDHGFHKLDLGAGVCSVDEPTDFGPESPIEREGEDEEMAGVVPDNNSHITISPSSRRPTHVAGNAVQLRKLRPSVSFASTSGDSSASSSSIDEPSPSSIIPMKKTTATTTNKSPKLFHRAFPRIPKMPSIPSCGAHLRRLTHSWGNPFKKSNTTATSHTSPMTTPTVAPILVRHSHSLE